MISEAEDWLRSGGINLKGPLAGIPVSLKDTVNVAGFDTTVGYSCYTGKPYLQDGPQIRLFKSLGAIPFVKTNVPISLLSFESTNDVWGRARNPHHLSYSPGGSSGGEGALLAFGGSRIGIGTDVAGSVRAPAHYSGCYSLRCSTGRWPKMGFNTSMPGQEGVPSVFSPMTRTLGDLTYFSRAILQAESWKLDHTVHPIPWREQDYSALKDKKRLRIGVWRTDGVVDPSPACNRALQETVNALAQDGHEVFDVEPPSPYEGLVLASQLLNADGCKTFSGTARFGEWMDRGARQLRTFANLPSWMRKVYSWYVRYIRRDEIWAGLLEGFGAKTAFEHWQLAAKREAYKARWSAWWNIQSSTITGAEKDGKSEMDLLITPPNALPAVPHDGMASAVSQCNYTFLFNLLDYSAGVLPVTKVDSAKDRLPATFDSKKLNGVARGAYVDYDADEMDGLPIGVQVVGRRLEEERVLAGMDRVEEALARCGGDGAYKLLRGWEM